MGEEGRMGEGGKEVVVRRRILEKGGGNKMKNITNKI